MHLNCIGQTFDYLSACYAIAGFVHQLWGHFLCDDVDEIGRSSRQLTLIESELATCRGRKWMPLEMPVAWRRRAASYASEWHANVGHIVCTHALSPLEMNKYPHHFILIPTAT